MSICVNSNICFTKSFNKSLRIFLIILQQILLNKNKKQTMKKLILALSLLISVAAFSQNGGQLNEDQYLKIEYVGNLTGQLTNKQACTVDVKITIDGGNQTTVTMAAGSTYQFPVVLGTRVIAKPLSNCAGTNENMGQVELKFTASVLPVKPNLSVARVSGNTFKVSFEVYNSLPANTYQLQLSRDGKTWQTIAVQFLDEVQPNKVYTLTVTIGAGTVNVKY
jgi:type 1 fimbria pilin